tara:strand:- start:93 stop:464 length:372 start_codon:yes stop_codon:yes gene_type:complete
MDFIDSTIIILAFTNNDKKEKCREILRKGGLTNSLVLIESFHSIERISKNREIAKDAIKAILNTLKIVPVDTNLIFEAIRRINKYNLKIFDLVHYVTSLLNNCSTIITYDTDFNDLEIKRVEP